MKKLLALLATPLLLAGCNIGGGGDTTIFSYETSITQIREAKVDISWNDGAKLVFGSMPKFEVIGDGPTFKSAKYESSRTLTSQLVVLTFSSDITTDFSGKLSYDYTNVKTKAHVSTDIELEFTVEAD